jgi:hypothetical protein
MAKFNQCIRNPRFLWLTFYSGLSFLILFQGRWAVTSSFGFDESCYLEYFHNFLAEPFPACYSRSLFWGVALTWWPIGLLVKFCSKIFSVPFTALALPVIGLFSYVQWVLSLFVIDRVCLIVTQNQGASRIPSPHFVSIAFLTLPVIQYVFRWNFFSHAAELFLVSLMFYFLVQRKYFTALFFSAWVFATRLNDVSVILVSIGALLDHNKTLLVGRSQRRVLFGTLGLCVFFVGVKFWRICFVTGYNGFYLADVLRSLKWEGVKGGFLNPFHGLLWFDFFWLFSIVYFTVNIRKLPRMQQAICIWQWSLVLIHVTQFVFWGYSENRLFIGSYLGTLFNLILFWPQMSNYVRKLFLLLMGGAAFMRVWYFIAATAPGLKYWVEVLGNRDSNFLLSTIKMLLRPGKTLEITAGLSPIGFSLFSWGKDWEIFSRYHSYSEYVISQPALSMLTVFTLLVVLVTAGAACFLLRNRKNKGSQSEASKEMAWGREVAG